jgi:UDP-N-acetylglucosamine:LPS N-acetylglucosamine transferase
VQFCNASRVVEAGAGGCLRQADLTSASVGRELDLLLQDARNRGTATAIAAEIAAIPPAHDALTDLTDLAD